MIKMATICFGQTETQVIDEFREHGMGFVRISKKVRLANESLVIKRPIEVGWIPKLIILNPSCPNGVGEGLQPRVIASWIRALVSKLLSAGSSFKYLAYGFAIPLSLSFVFTATINISSVYQMHLQVFAYHCGLRHRKTSLIQTCTRL